jgi:hypothetical protein
MSAAGKAKAKEDAIASGAKPGLEERVRERRWRPTIASLGNAEARAEAARRRAIEGRPTTGRTAIPKCLGGRE